MSYEPGEPGCLVASTRQAPVLRYRKTEALKPRERRGGAGREPPDPAFAVANRGENKKAKGGEKRGEKNRGQLGGSSMLKAVEPSNFVIVQKTEKGGGRP